MVNPYFYFLSVEGKLLNTKLHGPYKIIDKRGPVNYLLETPDRRKKTLLCPINLLRPYIERDNRFGNSALSTNLIIQNDCDKPTLSESNDSCFVIKHDTNKFNYSNDLTLSQKSDLDKLMFKFKDIFSDNPGRTHLGTHTILVKPDIQPVKCNAYRKHPDKQKILQAEVQKLLDLGLLRNSTSFYASPCLLLNKPDGGFRPVIDYSKLNKQTLCQAFPIDVIDDLIDKIGQAKFLTKLDITKAYCNVLLDEESIKYTGFVTPTGHYEFLVCSPWLSGACCTFNRIIGKVLQGLNACTAGYFDDVLVHNKSCLSTS